MVSIPDWARFSRLHDLKSNKNDPNSHLRKYYKQREEEAVRQAEQQGYFIVPEEKFILEHCRAANRKAKRLSQLFLVQLNGLHLRKVGEISMCLNLQICNLSNNFLPKIEPLAGCRHLVKLDLHSNQLSSIPGMAFWSGFRRLKFLHLHDNPLGKFETIHSLGTCPRLIGLTLYDTPLCLRKNYRHHVVNSVWTLRVLDHHVVSDEEIIEDSNFGGMFATMNPSLYIEMCLPGMEDNTYEDEVWLLQHIEARINIIQAHRSPVLIIQRYYRGYISRKRHSLGIQRHIKKGMQATSSELLPPPPSTPMNIAAQSLQDLGPDGISMDYDTYMKHRRPGSHIPSDATVTSVHHQSLVGSLDDQGETSAAGPGNTDSPRKKTNLVINLAKLQNSTFQSLQEDAVAIETIFSMDAHERSTLTDSVRRPRRKKKRDEGANRPRKVKSVKQFFGPMVETVEEEDQGEVGEDDTPITHYRLRGKRPNIHLVDTTTEMILERKEAGRQVREAEAEHHRKIMDAPLPRLVLPKHTTTDQRIFARVHGTMGMSCLFAVQKAYKDREKAEKAAAKMEYILNMREERMRARDRINMYHEEKRNQALKKRDRDRVRMLDSLERHELQRLNYLDRRMEVKNKANDVAKSHRIDQSFVTEFNNQHTSVSNALLRHDRQAKVEDLVQSKKRFVLDKKCDEGEQQTMVRKFMEHRQLMRQRETSTTRAALGTKLLQETNERFIEAQQRVSHLKTRRAIVQAFYPLPPNNVPSSAASAPPGISRWEASAMLSAGRIGRHHTMVL
ncbi:uncharacterized protein LOC124138349 [Haliotis rufescens]|uniref:uncharacterized protein LOC124138349 n=1 Tax=Haliotis rufescens TaxID=6454 RepID=UPI00201E86A6|nr:uncharacterized protein LOC124138349 [Haliotis rufescens]XP_046360901.2 uncharacterized protein LOC124138349 [Haliotis rufescens]XP_048244930.1 uncharacterized protein LOC124138349 [Haliotis rufescens]